MTKHTRRHCVRKVGKKCKKYAPGARKGAKRRRRSR